LVQSILVTTLCFDSGHLVFVYSGSESFVWLTGDRTTEFDTTTRVEGTIARHLPRPDALSASQAVATCAAILPRPPKEPVRRNRINKCRGSVPRPATPGAGRPPSPPSVAVSRGGRGARWRQTWLLRASQTAQSSPPSASARAGAGRARANVGGLRAREAAAVGAGGWPVRGGSVFRGWGSTAGSARRKVRRLPRRRAAPVCAGPVHAHECLGARASGERG